MKLKPLYLLLAIGLVASQAFANGYLKTRQCKTNPKFTQYNQLKQNDKLVIIPNSRRELLPLKTTNFSLGIVSDISVSSLSKNKAVIFEKNKRYEFTVGRLYDVGKVGAYYLIKSSKSNKEYAFRCSSPDCPLSMMMGLTHPNATQVTVLRNGTVVKHSDFPSKTLCADVEYKIEPVNHVQDEQDFEENQVDI